jgi:hypothetical protein
MKCPIHRDEDTRKEYILKDDSDDHIRTGYCSKCGQHYRQCTAVQYMNICDLVHGHQGPHTDAKGNQWTEEFYKKQSQLTDEFLNKFPPLTIINTDKDKVL